MPAARRRAVDGVRGLPGRSRRPGNFGEVPDVAGAMPTGSVTAGRAGRLSATPWQRTVARAARGPCCCRGTLQQPGGAGRVRGGPAGARPAPGRAAEATPRPQQAYGLPCVIGYDGSAPPAAPGPRLTLAVPPGASSPPAGGADPQRHLATSRREEGVLLREDRGMDATGRRDGTTYTGRN